MINSPLSNNQQKTVMMKEEDLSTIHHNMMVVYGWIPLEEFKSLPIPTLLSLAKLVNEEIMKRENTRITALKHYGVKTPK